MKQPPKDHQYARERHDDETREASSSVGLSDEEVAPFVRFDSYGAWGLAPQPVSEQLRLALMTLTVFPLRFLASVFWIALCYLLCCFSALFPPSIRDPMYKACGRFCCQSVLYAIGFRIKWVRCQDPPGSPGPAVLVCNHVSWTDIIIHMADSFPSFVARDGTQDLPLVGYLSRRLGCLYVQRVKEGKDRVPDKGAQGGGVSNMIKERVERKASNPSHDTEYHMMLFPEGTTTNGRYLLQFKTGAFLAGMPVRPYILKYSAQGRLYPSWDTIDIKRQIWLLFCQPVTHVTCYELPVYVPSEHEKKDPGLFASNVRKCMMEFASLKLSNATYSTKLAYIDAAFPHAH